MDGDREHVCEKRGQVEVGRWSAEDGRGRGGRKGRRNWQRDKRGRWISGTNIKGEGKKEVTR